MRLRYHAARPMGAQRLSASMESSPARSGSSCRSCTCAQRLSASMESSHARQRACATPSHVLNAFRHQWNPHVCPPCRHRMPVGAQRLSASMESSPHATHAVIVCVYLCSTPCGINGILTIAPSSSQLRQSCAQRLSASMESSPACAGFTVAGGCSTPFGINGILTRTADLRRRRACRCSTPCGINGILTRCRHDRRCCSTCAQRLSASMESSRRIRRMACCASKGAQRLSASMESSPSSRACHSAVSQCSTPCGINGILTHRQPRHRHAPCVLNAFRHQWNPHTVESVIDRASIVLNAFRHQWNPHYVHA